MEDGAKTRRKKMEEEEVTIRMRKTNKEKEGTWIDISYQSKAQIEQFWAAGRITSRKAGNLRPGNSADNDRRQIS